MEVTSPHRFEKICVLCGSYPGKHKIFAEEAVKVGEALAKESLQVIYGGGSLGLMGTVAGTAFAKGCQVQGIVPKLYAHMYGPTWGREQQVWSVPDKIAVMYHSANAFIILPGGLDTFEEIACVASWSSLNMHRKPLGFLNIKGYFDNLFAFFDNAVANGFMFSDSRRLLFTATTIEELLKKLKTYEYYSSPVTIDTSALGKRKRDCDKRGISLNLSL